MVYMTATNSTWMNGIVNEKYDRIIDKISLIYIDIILIYNFVIK